MSKKYIQPDYKGAKDYIQEKRIKLEEELKDLIYKYIDYDIDHIDILYIASRKIASMVYSFSYTENEALKLLKIAIKHGIFKAKKQAEQTE